MATNFPTPTTPIGYLRQLVDDSAEDSQALYWSDDQLEAYLEQSRRTVRLVNVGPSVAFGLIQPIYYYRMPIPRAMSDIPESVLLPSPDNTRFQARVGYRCWAKDPQPAIYLQGVLVGDNNPNAVVPGIVYDPAGVTIDYLNGAVHFKAPMVVPLNQIYTVQAAFDYFNPYEAAYMALTVALGTAEGTQSVDTGITKVQRAQMETALERLERIRDMQRPQNVGMGRIFEVSYIELSGTLTTADGDSIAFAPPQYANATSVAQVVQIALTTGVNTIALPSGTRMFSLSPPANNSIALNLDSSSGAPIDPASGVPLIYLPAGTTSVSIYALGDVTVTVTTA